ncbi:MAG: hypothetical protein AAGE01_02155 [Pseudomonadota bacterium]
MNPRTVRSVLRWSHLLLSGVLGAYLYSPLRTDPFWTEVILFLVFPLMGVLGLGLWQQAALMRSLKE